MDPPEARLCNNAVYHCMCPLKAGKRVIPYGTADNSPMEKNEFLRRKV